MTLLYDAALGHSGDFVWAINIHEDIMGDKFLLFSTNTNVIKALKMSDNSLAGTYTHASYPIDDYVNKISVTEDKRNMTFSGNIQDIIVFGHCD
jgi:hypothetical protein